MTNEELYLANRLFTKELGLEKVHLVRTHPEGDQDDLLIRSDKHPNRKGAEYMGFAEDDKKTTRVFDQALSGKIKAMIIFGQDLTALYSQYDLKGILEKLELSVFIGSNQNLTSEYTQWVLPAATYAEKNGTFTNFEGRVQRIKPALPPIRSSKPESEILTLFAQAFGYEWPYKTEEDVFDGLRRSVSEFQGMSYQKISHEGMVVP
jgi:predicted molibdopterin-dependent oxidoreductase YjgC